MVWIYHNLSIPLLMGIWMVSSFEQLWVKLLGTGVYKSLGVRGLSLLLMGRNGWDI